MAESSAQFHESLDVLRPETVERHRAVVSIMEELEAMDWYDQRIDATRDAELRAILEHNRDEEKEHASMVLEWLRRRDAPLDRFLRAYLFTERPVIEREEEIEAAGEAAPVDSGSLGIGSLRAEMR